MNWTICLLFLICVRRHCRWRWKPPVRFPRALPITGGCDMAAAFLLAWIMMPLFAEVNGQPTPPVIDVCLNTSFNNPAIPDYSSPNFSYPYPSNADCSRQLKAAEDHVIEIDFRGPFNIEGRDCHMLRDPFIAGKLMDCYCQYDFLEVRDGPYSYSPLIGRFCGKIYPPRLQSSGRYMFLRFKSDDAIQFEGFRIIHREVRSVVRTKIARNVTDCYIQLEGRDGLINSTFIPKIYITRAETSGAPMDCVFEIKVANHSQVLLRFAEIKLAKPDDCDIDFIDVHQSSLELYDRVREYCRDYIGGDTILLNTSRAFLRFMSDPKQLNENTFSGNFTALRSATHCEDKEFDCGDGYCIPIEFRCDHRYHCLNGHDEHYDCPDDDGWMKTTMQSVIISVVVGVIIIGVLAVAIYLTCNERQISQPRRYFTPAPLQKAVVTDEFGYGCTVDEMLARSKEEQVGYFVRHVQAPIVDHRMPSSRLVTSQSNTSSDWARNPRNANGTLTSSQTNSLPLSHSRPPRNIFGTGPRNPGRVVRSTSPQTTTATRTMPVADESFYVAGDDLDLHTSLKNGVPVFMYSPHTKRRLLRVA